MEGYYKLNNLVDVFPDPLVLTQSSKKKYLESTLNLRNLTNDTIIFKIFNNQPHLYLAKPSTSFISPMGTSKIIVKKFNNENYLASEQGKSSDKFLLLFYTINQAINDNNEAKEAFKMNKFNEDSKQETLISVAVKDDLNKENLERDYTYNESDIIDIGDDYIKGIKIYDNLIENLRKESNKMNEKIKEAEKVIEIVKQQKQFKNEKDKVMKEINNKKKRGEHFNNIVFLCVLLIGLLFGANFANGYNRIFNKQKININEEIIKKNNENIINKKINETNETIVENTTLNQNKINKINKININNTERNKNIDLNKNDIINKTNNDNINKTYIEKNETVNLDIAEQNTKSNNDILNKTKIDKIEKINKKNSNDENDESINKEKNNKIYKNEKPNGDFLSFSFLSGIYLCLLELLI